jgi:hypothetical protein
MSKYYRKLSSKRYAVIVLIGIGLGATLAYLISRPHIYWSKTIDAIGSIGTAGAFGVSLYLLRQSQQDRHVEQAKGVNIWNDPLKKPKTPPENWTYYTVRYHMKNTSNAPVYSVAYRASFGVRGTFVRRIGSLGPGEEVQNVLHLPAAPRGENLQADLVFTDASGRTWLRNSVGNLKSVNNSELTGFYKQDAGAFTSIEEHPTLALGEEIIRD